MPTPSGFAEGSYEIKHNLVSRSAFLTFGFDPSGTDAQTVANQVQVAFASVGSLASIIDNACIMVKTRVSLGTDGGEDIVGIGVTNVPCTKTVTSLPPNNAALVHKQTARGGRRGRGRMYIPWAIGATSVSEAGQIVAGDVTAVNAACAAWLTAMSIGAGPVVLLHRPSEPGTEHPTTPGPPNIVTSMSCDPLVGNQRRRLGR